MRILFATGNQNKITEAAEVLEPLGHSVSGLVVNGKRPEFDEPKDEGLEAVAESKIRQALSLIEGTEFEGYAILVEDSGIFLDAYDEWPGARSSEVEHELGLDGILELLQNEANRGAEYRAVAILATRNGVWKTRGICRGKIATEIRGEHGFGYDPIFIPDAFDGRTFGELGEEAKAEISHRSEAMASLVEALALPSK